MTVEAQLEIDLLIYGNAYCHIKKINGVEYKTRIDPKEMVILKPGNEQKMQELFQKHFRNNEESKKYIDNLKNEKQ